MRARLLCLALLLPAVAFAQDDDLLAPLPAKPKVHRKRTHSHRHVKRKAHEAAIAAPAPVAKPAPAPTPPTPAATAPGSTPAPAPKGGDEDLLELAPLELPTTLSVHVAGGVKDAEVLVDGADWGHAPVNAHSLPPGEHRVTIRRPGFADFTRVLTLKAGARGQVNAILDPTAGVLSIASEPSGAEVTVEGRPIGQTPLPQVLLPPGSYELRVRHPGYMDDVSRVAVRAGRDYPIDLKLVPNATSPAQVALAPKNAGNEAISGGEVSETVSTPKPWYKRWYVWAGVGAVAAGAAVGIAAASGGQSGSPIAASTVCGGTCSAVLSAP